MDCKSIPEHAASHHCITDTPGLVTHRLTIHKHIPLRCNQSTAECNVAVLRLGADFIWNLASKVNLHVFGHTCGPVAYSIVLCIAAFSHCKPNPVMIIVIKMLELPVS